LDLGLKGRNEGEAFPPLLRAKVPIQGEVQNEEIVSGYGYSKDQYVIVDVAKLDKLRTPDSKAVTIQHLISNIKAQRDVHRAIMASLCP
jgi:hypothetical protein